LYPEPLSPTGGISRRSVRAAELILGFFSGDAYLSFPEQIVRITGINALRTDEIHHWFVVKRAQKKGI
jgi:hypothetical protein